MYCTPFPILNPTIVLFLVLNVASYLTYRFLRRQIRLFGILTAKGFPQFIVIHKVKGSSVVNKAEGDVFSGTLLLFSMIQWMLAI